MRASNSLFVELGVEMILITKLATGLSFCDRNYMYMCSGSGTELKQDVLPILLSYVGRQHLDTVLIKRASE